MENKRLRIIYTVIKWVTLAVIILTLSAVAIKCLNIYSGGNGEYSREAVALAFTELSPIVYVCFLTILSGLIFTIFAPAEKHKTAISYTYRLLAYKNKYELNNEQVKKEEKMRRIFKTVFAVCAVASFVFPVTYLFNKENFTIENLNSDVIAAFVSVMIPTAIVFALALLCGYLCYKSEKREVAVYKAAVASGEAKKTVKTLGNNNAYVNYLRVSLICIAVILIVLGVFNDGIGDVYGKAVRICTECIGLG